MNGLLIKLVLLPACVGVSAWLIYDGQHQVVQAKADHDAALEQFTAMQAADKAVSRLGTTTKKVAEPESSAEEARFLAGLRKHARLQGASISKLSSTTETYREDPTLPSSKDLVGLTRISSHVTVVGPYASLYKFLESISSSQRLYVLSDMRWSRGSEGNTLALSITRYVQPASENS
ncbi:MAG: hypothetical protein ACAH95_05105 [Fimbriimonas sp.]